MEGGDGVGEGEGFGLGWGGDEGVQPMVSCLSCRSLNRENNLSMK